MCADTEIAEIKKNSYTYHHKIMRFSVLSFMLSVFFSAVVSKWCCLTKIRSLSSELSLLLSLSFSLFCTEHWAAWSHHLQLSHTSLKCSERQQHSVKRENSDQSAQHTAQESQQCHLQNWTRMSLMYDTQCDSTWAEVIWSCIKRTFWSASVRTAHWILL